jgi:hypothetical protein
VPTKKEKHMTGRRVGCDFFAKYKKHNGYVIPARKTPGPMPSAIDHVYEGATMVRQK